MLNIQLRCKPRRRWRSHAEWPRVWPRYTRAGMVHRDVKPSNVLLRVNGQPVLTDFGLAAVVADTLAEARLTPPGTLVGTADYLAPEVVLGREADARADLYALGVILYEMLAGYVPFAGRDSLQTLRAQVDERVPELPASVPAECV